MRRVRPCVVPRLVCRAAAERRGQGRRPNRAGLSVELSAAFRRRDFARCYRILAFAELLGACEAAGDVDDAFDYLEDLTRRLVLQPSVQREVSAVEFRAA